MVHSLVKIHADERLQFDDHIQGKGKGMIFLLHGEPGVGKTLTAGKCLLLWKNMSFHSNSVVLSVLNIEREFIKVYI